MMLITSSQAAKILNISKKTLYRWEQEGRIRVEREGVLNVRVYDRSYIQMVKRIIDLDEQEEKHLKKLPAIRERVKEHLFAHDVESIRSGEPLKFMDIEKASKAFDDEEAWLKEHERILNELFSYPKDIIREILQVK